MRDYGKVHSSFWTSSDMRELSEDGRTLAIYLLTCPHGTIAGCFRLADGYVTDDLQWDAERVAKGFAELFAKGFANRCETTKWVWIRKHLEWNPPENPNQRKAAQKIARQIPVQCGWIAHFIRDCAESLGWQDAPQGEPLANPSETVSKPVTVTVAVTETVAVGSRPDADAPPAPPKPKTSGKPTESAAGSAAFEAYAKAYEARYGFPPVRNAQTNTMFKRLVDKVGEHAPAVAAWYVEREGTTFYVSRNHPVDILLRDAEGLVTRMRAKKPGGPVAGAGRGINTLTRDEIHARNQSAVNEFLAGTPKDITPEAERV